jgi:hypothetical protein
MINTLAEQLAYLAASPEYPRVRTLTYPDKTVAAGTVIRGQLVKVSGSSEEDCLKQLNDLNMQSSPPAPASVLGGYSLEADFKRTVNAIPGIICFTVIAVIIVAIMSATGNLKKPEEKPDNRSIREQLESDIRVMKWIDPNAFKER